MLNRLSLANLAFVNPITQLFANAPPPRELEPAEVGLLSQHNAPTAPEDVGWYEYAMSFFATPQTEEDIDIQKTVDKHTVQMTQYRNQANGIKAFLDAEQFELKSLERYYAKLSLQTTPDDMRCMIKLINRYLTLLKNYESQKHLITPADDLRLQTQLYDFEKKFKAMNADPDTKALSQLAEQIHHYLQNNDLNFDTRESARVADYIYFADMYDIKKIQIPPSDTLARKHYNLRKDMRHLGLSTYTYNLRFYNRDIIVSLKESVQKRIKACQNQIDIYQKNYFISLSEAEKFARDIEYAKNSSSRSNIDGEDGSTERLLANSTYQPPRL